MVIWVNDQQLSLETSRTLTEILNQLDIPQVGIAIALNQEVIPRTEWATTYLQDHDKLLLIRATQGG